MKPAGRERDIEIAKLRGYKNKLVISMMCLNYSTNRELAWGLWDELENEFDMSFGKHVEAPFYVLAMHDKVFNGEDFADCVSKAWITWKEATR